MEIGNVLFESQKKLFFHLSKIQLGKKPIAKFHCCASSGVMENGRRVLQVELIQRDCALVVAKTWKCLCYLDVLQHNSASTLILVLHQLKFQEKEPISTKNSTRFGENETKQLYLASVLAFLVRLFQHELVESRQGHIITIEVISLQSKSETNLDTIRGEQEQNEAKRNRTYHRHVHVAGIQLKVDLLVNASFTLFVVVLTGKRHYGCLNRRNRGRKRRVKSQILAKKLPRSITVEAKQSKMATLARMEGFIWMVTWFTWPGWCHALIG